MKKIISTTLALTLSVLCSAKSATELAAEYGALRATGAEFTTLMAYAESNKTDVLTAFNTWKTSDLAALSADEVHKSKTLTKEQIEQNENLRMVFAKLYDNHGDEMTASDAVICNLRSGKVAKYLSQDWYDELKAADFKINGKQLGAFERLFTANSFGDKAYMRSLPAAEVMPQSLYVNAVIDGLLDMPAAEAKAKCKELENWYITHNKLDDANFLRVQAIGKVLTSRLIDEKLQGK